MRFAGQSGTEEAVFDEGLGRPDIAQRQEYTGNKGMVDEKKGVVDRVWCSRLEPERRAPLTTKAQQTHLGTEHLEERVLKQAPPGFREGEDEPENSKMERSYQEPKARWRVNQKRLKTPKKELRKGKGEARRCGEEEIMSGIEERMKESEEE
ncbi:hypothetical protein C8F01DRAFT_1228980 [Mycena amicta]|nr:hypothetical protein C8F01DRAFT_1228980 [Mycena amicta]